MSANKTSSDRNDQGFTLFEAMVVIAIVTTAIATFAYGWNANQSGAQLRTFTLELSSVLRSARAQAISDNKEKAFIFNATQRVFQVVPNGRVHKLPAELTLNLTAARLVNRRKDEAGIVFFGDGSSTGGTISVSNGQATSTIDVSWLTGSVLIDEVGG